MIARIATALVLMAGAAMAQEADPPMTPERLARIAMALDDGAEWTGAGLELTIEDIPVLIVMDPRADRMRAMVPIRSAEGMSAEELMRVMQANFDSALDARYAVAGGRLWGVFIHPLSPLERDQFVSALAQTVNVARTYGTLYSGGAMQFGSGDSAELHRRLIEELQDEGEAL